MARKRLDAMPCGDVSPLAHGLQCAMLTGINAQKSGDVGKEVVVMISDCRADVSLGEHVCSESRQRLEKRQTQPKVSEGRSVGPGEETWLTSRLQLVTH
jgi:Mg-chelatase subunit ChlD